jgi:ankyrin repeat protein
MAHETDQSTTLDFGLLADISKNSRVVFEDQQSINKSLTAFFTSDSNLTDAFNTLAERDQKFVISLFLRVCIGDKTADAEQQMDRKIRDGMSDSGNSFVAALKDLLGQEYNRRREISVKKDNEAQNELFSQPFTIWHAVSKFGESRGRTSWCVVKYVVSFLSKEKISCPWMRGDDLGVFGETPLHVALLCNEPSYEAEDMFLFLWKHCENIRDKKYSEKKYEGENVLHLAIVRNFSVEFLEKIYEIDRARWGELLKAAATGDFFNDKEEGCHMLGELPLFFAACYDRRDVFEYLVKTGSKLIDVTSKGNNLLHVMIEREKVVSCSEVTTKLSMLEMLDCVFKTLHNKEDLEGKPIYDDLIHQRNKAGQTPIMLAAAMGSPQIFEYFFESTNVDVAWVYGSVECVKIRLDGSDPAFCDSKGTSAIRSGESVLDLLVKSKRRDILTTSIIGQVIERKWEKYGSTIFCTRLFLSSLYALAVVLVPVFEWTSIRAAVHVFAIFILDQITHPKYFSESLLSQFVYRPLNKEQIVVGSQRFVGRVIIDVVSWALWQLPLLSGGSASLRTFLLPRLSVWVLKASFLVFVFGLVAEKPLNTYWIVHEYPVLHYLQTILYASSGILAFCNIVSSLIVFEGYGSLVFMLTNTLRRDLPMFAVAYVIFLICFAYYHFLASNNLHSGLLSQGGDSMWRIFSAMVGEFVDEDQKICQYTSTRVIVMGISVANYFFVTVVLVNLLIAFLTNTIEEISNEACMEWRLQRARILLEEDARLSDQQMDSMKYLMSKPDVLDSDSTLLTSTKSLKGLPSRSKKDLHNTNKSEPRDR